MNHAVITMEIYSCVDCPDCNITNFPHFTIECEYGSTSTGRISRVVTISYGMPMEPGIPNWCPRLNKEKNND